MKSVRTLLCAVLMAVIATSCSSGGLDRVHYKDGELGELMEYESANEALLDYVANVEYLKVLYLEITSEGFTKPLMCGDEDNFNAKLLDDYYAHMEHMAVNIQSYKAAADAFADAGFMNPDTRIGALTIISAIGTVSTVVGLVSFENYLATSSQEGQKAMAKTFRALSGEEQTKAFRKIPENRRNGCRNAEEYIQMAENGDLGNDANRVHANLTQEPSLEYGAKAIELKCGRWDVFKKVGTEGLNNGVSVALEAPGACASGEASVGVGMTLVELTKKGYELAKQGIKAQAKIMTGAWLLDMISPSQAEEMTIEANAVDALYKAQHAKLPSDIAKIKIKAPKEKGKIAVLTRKEAATRGFPTTYIAPVGKGTSEVVVESGDYEIVVADKDGYVDVKKTTYEGGRTYEEEFDTSKNKPGAGGKPESDTGNASSIEKKLFGKEISQIEVKLEFVGDYKVTDDKVTMDRGRNIKMNEIFKLSENEIVKRVDKTHLIYEVKRHSFDENYQNGNYWERYDNNTLIKINRRSGNIDYIKGRIEDEKENIYYTTEEFTDRQTKHETKFTSVFEFTIDKPVKRDSGNWIMYYSNNPSLTAGIVQNHNADGKITKTVLDTIYQEGIVLQVYME